MADQATLVGDPELSSVGELARLAGVVHQRGRHQQIRVESWMKLADLADQCPDRDRVLQESADVRVMPRAGAGCAPKVSGDRLREQHPFHHPPEGSVVDLPGKMLEEALQL